MTNQNQNRAATDVDARRLVIAQLRRLVQDALPSSTARRDKRGAWGSITELATGHVARDELFSGQSVVIRVATRKRGGKLVTRASLEAKMVEDGYTSYGYSTAGLPAFRLETDQRATGLAVHRQHILALRGHAFEQWAATAISYAAAGGPL